MSGVNGSVAVPSLPPPQPKSPPELYGRRRELAKVQRMEREIGFLEEELKSIEGLQLSSRSCKEVTEFVTGNADPFIPTAKKIRRSCRFWKWLCGGVSCFKVSWICCCSCPSRLKMPSCCDCDTCNPCGCIRCTGSGCCRMPKSICCCFSCCNRKCFKISKCSMDCCCSIPKCRCPTCSSSCTMCITCPKFLQLKNICSCCRKSSSCCCYPCYICY